MDPMSQPSVTEQPDKPKCFSKADALSIIIGKDDNVEEYTVHKSYMTKTSGLIRAALNRDWKEARDNSITIPDHEPEAFEGYLSWIYSRRIITKGKQCESCDVNFRKINTTCNQAHSLGLAKMYILGDYLDDKIFCNSVVDALKSGGLGAGCYLPSEAFEHVWQNVSSESPLRDLVCEIWKTDLRYLSNGKCLAELPKNFLVDLLEYIGNHVAEESDPVDFHVEEQGNLLQMQCSFHRYVDDQSCCSENEST